MMNAIPALLLSASSIDLVVNFTSALADNNKNMIVALNHSLQCLATYGYSSHNFTGPSPSPVSLSLVNVRVQAFIPQGQSSFSQGLQVVVFFFFLSSFSFPFLCVLS
jgi:hypothetical protein